MLKLLDVVHATPPRFEDVAWAIASDEYPSLRGDQCSSALDELAAPVAERVAAATETASKFAALCDYLYGERGYRGNDDYDDPRNNYLNDVIEGRRGSPVTMAVLLIAVARRAGLVIAAIGFPGHFLVRAGEDDPIFADPFDGSHPLPRGKLEQLAFETLGGDPREALRRLEPVGARTIAVRILLNLQRIYRARQDHAHLLVVCDRLFDMTGAPFHQCDRGIHALALGATQTAIHDLEAYLDAHPDAADAADVGRVLDKARRSKKIALS